MKVKKKIAVSMGGKKHSIMVIDGNKTVFETVKCAIDGTTQRFRFNIKFKMYDENGEIGVDCKDKKINEFGNNICIDFY